MDIASKRFKDVSENLSYPASIALNVFVSYSDFDTICIAIKGQEQLSLLRKLPSRSKAQGQMQRGTMATPKWQKF